MEQNKEKTSELQKCPIHKKKLKIFCIDKICDIPQKQICSHCLLQGSLHAQHQAQTIEQVDQKIKEDAKNLHQKIQDLREEDQEKNYNFEEQVRNFEKQVVSSIESQNYDIKQILNSITSCEYIDLSDGTLTQLKEQGLNFLQNIIQQIEGYKTNQKILEKNNLKKSQDENSNINQELISEINNNNNLINFAEDKQNLTHEKLALNEYNQNLYTLNIVLKLIKGEVKLKSNIQPEIIDKLFKYIQNCQAEFKIFKDNISTFKENLVLFLNNGFKGQQKLKILQHKSPIFWIEDIDDSCFASCGENIYFWEKETFKIKGQILLQSFDESRCIKKINDLHIVVGLSTGSVQAYEIRYIFNEDYKQTRIMCDQLWNKTKHQDEVTGIFRVNSKQFLTTSFDFNIFLWNLNGEIQKKFMTHRSILYKQSIALYQESYPFELQQYNDTNNENKIQYFLSISHDKTIKLWDLDSQQLNYQDCQHICEEVVPDHEYAISICFVGKSNKFVTGHASSFRIYQLNINEINDRQGEQQENVFVLLNHISRVHTGIILDISFIQFDQNKQNLNTNQDCYMVSGSEDNSIKIWKFDFNQNIIKYILTLKEHFKYVQSVIPIYNQNSIKKEKTKNYQQQKLNFKLVSGSLDKNIIIWE
ncbi:WD40-repeat-containing domain [Pseudocohnilembus persalinus]|uniref:WD40-repeat-containing domain n=1 Tax=Pseudocohnilembus persalinus TaxID=266149 RepID=A0A0V0QCW6_PSEPJ|nr:WD40-repeat-containing domain [Pseudocohnilembus persalinus]|eukprot:KRW99924.1 WD40-repeat-containing domain [Pseudocohnilembus persalinus]